MRPLFRFLPCALLAMFVLSAPLIASPQEQDVSQVKERLQQPPGPKLQPSKPVELRPVFKSQVERHPWVPTLEQELHKEFDLNDFQRQSAEWRAKCCGINLGQVLDAISTARRNAETSSVRAQIRRELADLEAARAAAATVK